MELMHFKPPSPEPQIVCCGDNSLTATSTTSQTTTTTTTRTAEVDSPFKRHHLCLLSTDFFSKTVMDVQQSPPQADGEQHATTAVNTAANEIINVTDNASGHDRPAQLHDGTNNSSAEQGNSAAVAALNARGTSAPPY